MTDTGSRVMGEHELTEKVARALLVAREGLDVPDSHLSDYERHLARAAIAALRPAMTDQPRFFIDHGQIHDRVTGKHVTTDEDTVFCDGINHCLTLLNELAALGDGWPSLSPELIDKLGKLATYLTEQGEYEACDLIDTVVERLTPKAKG